MSAVFYKKARKPPPHDDDIIHQISCSDWFVCYHLQHPPHWPRSPSLAAAAGDACHTSNSVLFSKWFELLRKAIS